MECSKPASELDWWLDDIEVCVVCETVQEKPWLVLIWSEVFGWAPSIGEYWTADGASERWSLLLVLLGVEWSGLEMCSGLTSFAYSTESDKSANLLVYSKFDWRNDEVKLGNPQLQHIQTYDGCCSKILKLTLLMPRQSL